MASSNVLSIIANAKINLGLEVLRRRDDGFHDIVTILQEIDLSDRLTFRTSREITLEGDTLTLPLDHNLVFRAARALQQATGIDRGAAIRLEKSIPVAGGLGGGSSDAAATLVALNELWNLRLDDDSLLALARELGSDVAFFLRGGTQIGTGKGDVLRPLRTPTAWVAALIIPLSIPDKTRSLYQSLRSDDLSDGSRVRAIAEDLDQRGVLRPLDHVNTFERPALELYSDIRQAFETVRDIGGRPLLSGAGPTVLTVHQDERDAHALASRARSAGYSVVVASTVQATRCSRLL